MLLSKGIADAVAYVLESESEKNHIISNFTTIGTVNDLLDALASKCMYSTNINCNEHSTSHTKDIIESW